MYILLLAHIDKEPLAVTTNCSIDFLQKPDAGEDMVADCSLLKLGSTLIVGEVLVKTSRQEDLWQDLQLHILGQKLKVNYFYGFIFGEEVSVPVPFVETDFIFEVSVEFTSFLLFLAFWFIGSSCL